MTVETLCGKIKGIREEKYEAFRGIPYGRAGRFGRPSKVCWEGTLDCTRFGKKAMQVFSEQPMFPWEKPQHREEFDEDCLNLTVYRPLDVTEKEKLPVLFYIHGGGFQTGSSQVLDPARVIRDHRIILVAIQYRLGIWGYLYLGDALGEEYAHSGNCGTLDQLAALGWVHENIGSFGGDPGRITVCGESAGAKSIGALMFRQEMEQWCRQILAVSGAVQSIRTEKTAAEVTGRFLKAAGIRDAKQLLTMSPDELLEAQKKFCAVDGNTCFFGPVADGVVLPRDWQRRYASGDYWSGAAVIGCSLHEMGFYRTEGDNFQDRAPEVAKNLFGKNGETVLAEYAEWEEHHPAAEAGEKTDIWIELLSDYMYRLHSYRLAEHLAARGCDVWQYSFELGEAVHCMDFTLAFGNAEDSWFCQYSVREMEALGEQIHRAFLHFVERGDPNCDPVPCWPKLSRDSRKQMVWDSRCEAEELEESPVHSRFPEIVYELEPVLVKKH